MNIDFRDTHLLKFLEQSATVYFGKALELRDTVEMWLSYVPETFPHYTSHTIRHSDEIIVQISNLLFDEARDAFSIPLTPVEAYILVAAAYLHDAGMVAADDEKLQIITSNPEWLDWIGNGGGALRWARILEIRSDQSIATERRNFVADLQTRFLIAEFIRRNHHLRAGTLIRQREHELGRFALNDPSLIRTIADVCIAHGLNRSELEDNERFPENRDIQGYKVNVRLLAILLRLGDLLDMSYDRACPLLLNAACPIPSDSYAHWTQYQRISHRSTSPSRIEITAECLNQDEHRILQDWCGWIVDEIQNATILMSRSQAKRKWEPPFGRIGEDGTIKIRPAEGATYLPSAWSFEMDKENVLQLLIKDVYDSPIVFVRELIQNALDAMRCRLYLELEGQGLSTPSDPSQVSKEFRDKFSLHISLDWRELTNPMSGEPEKKQVLTIDDSGVGMSRDVIERYFLQIGRSFYTSESFRRRYKFTPTSRFGIGFLSVFAVSDQISIETFDPLSTVPAPILLTLTGPRNYLLTERGHRSVHGTRIEVVIREPFDGDTLMGAVLHWCKRVEFDIHLTVFGAAQIVVAESALDFEFERFDMRHDGARFFVKAFPIKSDAVRGELYIRGRRDETGESWASGFFGDDTSYHPSATSLATPLNLVCLHGINLYSRNHYQTPYRTVSFRVDIRDPQFNPELSRNWFSYLPPEYASVVESALSSAVENHINGTEASQLPAPWRYRNMVLTSIGIEQLSQHSRIIPGFWNSLEGTVPVYCDRILRSFSVNGTTEFPSLLTTHSRRIITAEEAIEAGTYDWESTAINSVTSEAGTIPCIIGDDLSLLASGIANQLFEARAVSSLRTTAQGLYLIEWTRIDELDSTLPTRLTIGSKFGRPNVIGLCLYGIDETLPVCFGLGGQPGTRWSLLIWNMAHPFVQWMVRLQNAVRISSYNLEEPLNNLTEIVNGLARRPYAESVFQDAQRFVDGWNDMSGIPDDLRPPEIELASDLFVLLR